MYSNEMECLINNQVPNHWKHRTIKSMKPLMEWMMELCCKVNYMKNWIENGQPHCIELNMLMNPEAFFMCMKEWYQRKHCVRI